MSVSDAAVVVSQSALKKDVHDLTNPFLTLQYVSVVRALFQLDMCHIGSFFVVLKIVSMTVQKNALCEPKPRLT